MEAAQALRGAMRGIGTDEDLIMQTLINMDSEQRVAVKLEYHKLYPDRDLIKDLKSELSGNFEDLILALMHSKSELDAIILRESMKGAGTDEEALIEVLCTRTNAEIVQIKSQYSKLFQRHLENDIMSDTSGDFRKFLNQLVQGKRSEKPADAKTCSALADQLYQAGEGRWGTDESAFQKIVLGASPSQLKGIEQQYLAKYGKQIDDVMRSELNGPTEVDLLKCYLAVFAVARDAPAYFATRLHKAMKGGGTDDKSLIRLVVTRSERDMVQIKEVFQKLYGKSLSAWITDETSGDYKKALLLLLGN